MSFTEKLPDYEWISGLRVHIRAQWDEGGHEVAWVVLETPSFSLPAKITLLCECDITVEAVLPTGFLGDAEKPFAKAASSFGYRVGRFGATPCAGKEAVAATLQREAYARSRTHWEALDLTDAVIDVFTRSCAGEPMGQEYADELTLAEVAAILQEDIVNIERAVCWLENEKRVRPVIIGSVLYTLAESA